MSMRIIITRFLQGFGITFGGHLLWVGFADLYQAPAPISPLDIQHSTSYLLLSLVLLVATAWVISLFIEDHLRFSLFENRAAISGVLWYLVLYSLMGTLFPGQMTSTFFLTINGILFVAYAYFKLFPAKKPKQVIVVK